jgi:hypothetical protein
MEKLTIHAATPESAQAILAALSAFRAELVETDGRREVVVPLGRSDRDVVAVLNALELYVTERGSGPALVELGDQTYVMQPAPESE